MKKLNLLILFVLISTYSIFSQTKITPAKAKNFICKKVIVIGVIDEVYESYSDTYFLDMDAKYPDNTFTAVIFKSDANKFSNINKFEGKQVQINGPIKGYQGRPEIILNSVEQIKLLITSKNKKVAKTKSKS